MKFTKTLKGINMTDVQKSMINHESWLIITASNPNVEWFPCRKAPFSWSAIAHGRSTNHALPVASLPVGGCCSLPTSYCQQTCSNALVILDFFQLEHLISLHFMWFHLIYHLISDIFDTPAKAGSLGGYRGRYDPLWLGASRNAAGEANVRSMHGRRVQPWVYVGAIALFLNSNM